MLIFKPNSIAPEVCDGLETLKTGNVPVLIAINFRVSYLPAVRVCGRSRSLADFSLNITVDVIEKLHQASFCSFGFGRVFPVLVNRVVVFVTLCGQLGFKVTSVTLDIFIRCFA